MAGPDRGVDLRQDVTSFSTCGLWKKQPQRLILNTQKHMAIGNDVIHTLDIVLGCQKSAGDENLGPHHSGKGFLKQQKAADR